MHFFARNVHAVARRLAARRRRASVSALSVSLVCQSSATTGFRVASRKIISHDLAKFLYVFYGFCAKNNNARILEVTPAVLRSRYGIPADTDVKATIATAEFQNVRFLGHLRTRLGRGRGR